MEKGLWQSFAGSVEPQTSMGKTSSGGLVRKLSRCCRGKKRNGVPRAVGGILKKDRIKRIQIGY